MKRARRSRARAFTLIELMITLAVAAILAATAVEGYQNIVRKSRRAEARTELMRWAHYLDRCLSQFGVYLPPAADPPNCPIDSPQNSLTGGYYSITTTRTATTYTLTATAQGSQLEDKRCRTFTLTHVADKTAKDSQNNSVADCW